jgi:hypothetical protein
VSALDCILAAFSPTLAPEPDEIPSNRQGRIVLEARMVQSYFAGKSWRDITLEWLQAYPGDEKACLQFMSFKSFCYYYPSFMTVCLIDETDKGELLDRVVGFADDSARNHERFMYLIASYNKAQQIAVGNFLCEVDNRFVRLQLGERSPRSIYCDYWMTNASV